MKKTFHASGVIPACLMPFDSNLEIDESAYRRHLRDLASVEGVTAITVNGGDPSTDADTVTITGDTGADGANFTPNAVDGGSFATTGLATAIDLNGIERLIYDGENDNEALTITGTNGADAFNHVAGSANDAGTVQINNLLAIEYVSLGTGAAADVILTSGGGTDTATLSGTSGDDTFAVDGSGDVVINTPLAAVASAVAHATGHQVRSLPITPEKSLLGE